MFWKILKIMNYIATAAIWTFVIGTACIVVFAIFEAISSGVQPSQVAPHFMPLFNR
jgi:uncharacterized membrane protein (DUF373 family)